MSVYRLNKKTSIKIAPSDCAKTVLAVFSAGNIVVCVMRLLGIWERTHTIGSVIWMIVMLILYYALLKMFGCINKKDREWLEELVM